MTAETQSNAVADDVAEDLADGDSLLGIPWSRLADIDAVRSLGLVVVAMIVLVWPRRTDRVLGVLVGIALVALTVTLVVEVLRHSGLRTFWRLLGTAVAGGFAAALLTHPDDSLTSIVQLGGLALGTLAAVEVGRMVAARQVTAWPGVKAAALALGAALLLLFPETLLATVTSVSAALVGITGVIRLFGPEDTQEEPDRTSRSPSPRPMGETLMDWMQRRPDLAEDRDVLQDKVFFEGPSAPVRFARFAALMVFASIIASIGVVVESTAVVIGAMLIAPLMTPLMGTALSLTMGWPRRMRRCAGIAASGTGIAISIGAIVGAIGPRTVDVTGNPEIVSRISPTTVDLAIAVAAGAAGAYALARRDVSDSLPGVAVAIALVPPLAVVGLCWEQQAWAAGNGALLLFVTNAIAIVLAGGAMFVLVGAAPVDRVSAGQERLRTATVGLVALGGAVLLLLLLNGQALARAELARAGVDEAIADWTAEHEDFRVVGRRVLSDGTIVVDLAGPGRPPELDELRADLEDALGDDVRMRVTWVDQEQVELGAQR